MSETTPKLAGPEEIVIVGGGLEGCLLALLLSRVNLGGIPKFNITLLEAESELLNGASLVASRLHLGAEYPLHVETALDCLWGAVIWKLTMPADIYTNREPMKFSISKNTQAEGVAAKGDSKKESETLTVEKFEQHLEIIRKEYEKIFNMVHAAKKAEHGTTWKRRDTAELLFGFPDKGKFYSQIPKSCLRPYDGSTPGAFSDAIAGVFQTQEPGLNIPLHLSAIEAELHRQKNITVHTCSKVKRVISPDITGDDMSHVQLVGAEGSIFKANVPVLAAYDKNMEIIAASKASKVASTTESAKAEIAPSGAEPVKGKVKVLRRAMIMLDLEDVPGDLQSIFRMLGEIEGAMLSPYDERYTIAYLPMAAYYGGEAALDEKNPSQPPEWDSLGPTERKAWAKEYLRAIKIRFPCLEKAKIACFDSNSSGLIVRNTLTYDDKLTKRRHQPTQWVDGILVMNATKATLAVRSAAEGLEIILARSQKREPNIDRAHIMDLAAKSAFSLSKIPVDRLKGIDFAHAHPPLSAYMINMDDPSLVSHGENVVRSPNYKQRDKRGR